MTQRFSLALYSIIVFSLILFPRISHAAPLLSEVSIAGEKASDEFVELYNTSVYPVSLSGWSLRRKSISDTTTKGLSLRTFSSADTIPGHGYFLWANSSSTYKDIADTTTSSSLTENNSLALFDASGTMVDALTWGTGHISPFVPSPLGNPSEREGITRDLSTLTWSISKSLSPTNSKGEPWKEKVSLPPEPTLFKQIFINEVFPNPKEKNDKGEFIEFYNPETTDISLSRWEVHDDSATGKYIFPEGSIIHGFGYLVITDNDFTFSLNNSNETISLFDQEKRLVHTVSYEKTKEGVALNLVNGKLHGGRAPTPGSSNDDNANPTTKERVPKNGYKNFTTEFRARGKDRDGDKLKFTWDFGDGHKSYKENTIHKYTKSGKYTVTLTTDDGIDTVTETFSIKITKYIPPKLVIIRLLPNPKGKDAKNEWIEIENHEKKSVDLKGFSIATGTKKKSLTNHPLRDNFILPGKSLRRITGKESLFTLGNKQDIIELRAPDGKTIQKLAYHFEKSLGENVILEKKKGQGLVPLSLQTEVPKVKEKFRETREEISNTSPKQIPEEVLRAENTITLASANQFDIPVTKNDGVSGSHSFWERLWEFVFPLPRILQWQETINQFFNTLLSQHESTEWGSEHA